VKDATTWAIKKKIHEKQNQGIPSLGWRGCSHKKV
jgi:hypothetical protein